MRAAARYWRSIVILASLTPSCRRAAFHRIAYRTAHRLPPRRKMAGRDDYGPTSACGTTRFGAVRFAARIGRRHTSDCLLPPDDIDDACQRRAGAQPRRDRKP